MDSRYRTKPIDSMLVIQLVTLVATTVFFLCWQGYATAIAAAFGCGISLGNTLLQRWHLVKSVESAKSDAGKNLGKAYRCVIERWIWTFLMFAIGFGLFREEALPLLVGFIVTQCVLFFGNIKRA